MDHVQLSRNLRPDGESWANSDEVSRAMGEIKKLEEEKRQNTVHLGSHSPKAGTEDKETDFAENLGSEPTGAEAQQSRQQGALPTLTEYLRDLGHSSYSYSSRVTELAKNSRMPFLSSMEEGGDFTGLRYAGHPLTHPQTGAQIWYWAPDFEGSDVQYKVVCLAVSKYRGYILCLGLHRTGRQRNRYRRIGLAFWNANARDECSGLGVRECVIV